MGNKGNFLALVDFSIRSGNKALGDHLKSASRNAVYTSKTTQNECIGDHIRDKVLADVQKANIREEFVDFVSVERITGEVLAAKIKEMLVKYKLDLSDCRGQGYDGASNMSGESGVQDIY